MFKVGKEHRANLVNLLEPVPYISAFKKCDGDFEQLYASGQVFVVAPNAFVFESVAYHYVIDGILVAERLSFNPDEVIDVMRMVIAEVVPDSYDQFIRSSVKRMIAHKMHGYAVLNDGSIDHKLAV